MHQPRGCISRRDAHKGEWVWKTESGVSGGVLGLGEGAGRGLGFGDKGLAASGAG